MTEKELRNNLSLLVEDLHDLIDWGRVEGTEPAVSIGLFLKDNTSAPFVAPLNVDSESIRNSYFPDFIGCRIFGVSSVHSHDDIASHRETADMLLFDYGDHPLFGILGIERETVDSQED